MKIGKFILLLVTTLLLNCNNDSININSTPNFYKGVETAKELGKPIFLYFSCYGCMANDEFEKELISSDEIRQKLKEQFVSIILYVDDKTALTQLDIAKFNNIVVGSNLGAQEITQKTKGHLNSNIQKQLFGEFYQPMYAIITARFEVLVKPFGYTNGDKKYFIEKLEEGLRKYPN